MIFDLTRDYVPDAYIDSRDYRTFLRQLGVLTSVFKYNIDHFPDLYSPEECPDHMLPLLATMVGYNYKDSRPIDGNRKIIKYFPYLIRNRGSETGLRMASILSINIDSGKDMSYSVSNIIIEVDVDSGVINIYHPRDSIIDMELIEVVRPVGMRLNFIPTDFAFLTDELGLKSKVRIITKHKYFDQSLVGSSQVGFDTNEDTRQDSKLDVFDGLGHIDIDYSQMKK